jgi:hypothetical protein
MNGEETKAVAEIAKATGELAKTSGKVVDASTSFGSWLSKTLGTIPEDLLGIAGGDFLHEQRKRNLISLKAKTAEIRTRINAGPPQEPSVSVVLPLLKAAADEQRPELQELWAGLLASALQQDGGRRVRRAFFDTLAQMEPVDALLFEGIAQAKLRVPQQRVSTLYVGKELGITGEEFSVAMSALHRLDLLGSTGLGVTLSQYGLAFWKACSPQGLG